jgi:glycine/D-amino acid oxidase-like deaminating enzyme
MSTSVVLVPIQGEIDAPVVVAATGTTTRPLFRQVGYDLPIDSEYHQVAILKNVPGIKGKCIDSATATYFRSDGLDKFLVGDFYGQRGVDAENFPQNASVESLEELIEHACRRVPRLQNAEIMRGVTGVYDMTLDLRPLLGGRFQEWTGLSELLLDGCAKSVDISPFRLSRFAERLPIKAEYEYKDD